MQASQSVTRRAWATLWVTMTMVCRSFSRRMSSSMACGAARIERARRFVHEDDLGLHGERAREAEALLLADGKRGRRTAQAVLHFVPQRGFAQRGFDERKLLAARDGGAGVSRRRARSQRCLRERRRAAGRACRRARARRSHRRRARRSTAPRRSTSPLTRRPGIRSLSRLSTAAACSFPRPTGR